MAYVKAACTGRVTIFSTGGKLRTGLEFYVVTRSFSSRPFLCTLADSMGGNIPFIYQYRFFPTTGVLMCSCSTSVVITAVVSCAVSFIIAALVGVVIHYCTVRKKCDCPKFYSLTRARKKQQQQPAPVYDDIVRRSQNIELKENVAYGPGQQ